jgi:uncharacterized membrane protein
MNNLVYTIKLYIVVLVSFFAIDLVWLGVVARTLYRKYLGFIMAPSPNWLAAVLFYLLFIAGILVFVLSPGLEANSLRVTLIRAALYGLITYATYDLTNLATLKDWPLTITVIDMTWGTILSVSVSWIGFLAGRWLR